MWPELLDAEPTEGELLAACFALARERARQARENKNPDVADLGGSTTSGGNRVTPKQTEPTYVKS
jgi:hypothetical protein